MSCPNLNVLSINARWTSPRDTVFHDEYIAINLRLRFQIIPHVGNYSITLTFITVIYNEHIHVSNASVHQVTMHSYNMANLAIMSVCN